MSGLRSQLCPGDKCPELIVLESIVQSQMSGVKCQAALWSSVYHVQLGHAELWMIGWSCRVYTSFALHHDPLLWFHSVMPPQVNWASKTNGKIDLFGPITLHNVFFTYHIKRTNNGDEWNWTIANMIYDVPLRPVLTGFSHLYQITSLCKIRWPPE